MNKYEKRIQELTEAREVVRADLEKINGEIRVAYNDLASFLTTTHRLEYGRLVCVHYKYESEVTGKTIRREVVGRFEGFDYRYSGGGGGRGIYPVLKRVNKSGVTSSKVLVPYNELLPYEKIEKIEIIA